MSKTNKNGPGSLDWSDLYAGKVGEPEDPRSKPVEKDCHKGGEKITKDDLKKDAQRILDGFNVPGKKQPNKAEFEAALKLMYPELNKTDEEWDQVEKRWNNMFQDWMNTAANVSIDNKSVEWGNGKSFKEMLSEEDLEKYQEEEKQLNKKITE